jgi:uracil-DNA glycosylase
MGFCYPGKAASGDMSPRPECAPMWHPRLLSALKRTQLIIYVGKYAFDRYLASEFASVTAAVEGFRTLLPMRVALPHPSPRNNIWLKRHPWFETEVLPALQARVHTVLAPR